MLCLTLTGKTLQENLEQIERNRECIDLAELRLDLLEPSEQLNAELFPSLVTIPLILTLRRTQDGGACDLPERQRLQLLRNTAKGDFSYVDIEDDVKQPVFETELRSRGIRIIRSFHDYSGIPDDIFARITRAAKKNDIPKAAVMVNSIADVATLFRAETELAGIEKIIVGMGEHGIPTRILYKRLGSYLTFCSDSSEQGAAPGHLSAKTMKQLYQSDKVTQKTMILGIIGNPVMHSDSPRIHNSALQTLNLNAIYVPFLVDSVRTFFRLAETLPIHGFSVTIPFKHDVVPYLGKITREVKQIGSCNTVVKAKGMWKGINTDYYGFITPILPYIESERIQQVLVVGAGGAARAVVWALRYYRRKVIIINRNVERAKALAQETMSSYDTLEHASQYVGLVDLIVQTTSVGMVPDETSDPIEDFAFSGKEIVFDLVYKPYKTKLLSRAETAGCTLVYGMEMLQAQAVLQFEAFTGLPYPSD